jgi:hypothetical protein
MPGNSKPVNSFYFSFFSLTNFPSGARIGQPRMTTRPTEIEANPEQYLAWCARAKAGEFDILSVIVLSNARYRLKLLWPAQPKPHQTTLFQ